jgi:hypothetical protein
MKFVILRGRAEGNRFYTTYVEGLDSTKLADGTVAYDIMSYADTAAEAQAKLGYGTHQTTGHKAIDKESHSQ